MALFRSSIPWTAGFSLCIALAAAHAQTATAPPTTTTTTTTTAAPAPATPAPAAASTPAPATSAGSALAGTACVAAFSLYPAAASSAAPAVPAPAGGTGAANNTMSPNVSVQATVGGIGSATPAPSGATATVTPPPPPAPTPATPALATGAAVAVLTGVMKITGGKSAYDVAAALGNGRLAGVTLTPAGPYTLIYTMDPTKIGRNFFDNRQHQIVDVVLVPPGPPAANIPAQKTPAAAAAVSNPPVAPVSARFDLTMIPAGPIPTPVPVATDSPILAPGTLAITTSHLPQAIAGSQYRVQLQYAYEPRTSDPRTPDPKPTWGAGANLPPWLTLNDKGVLSGIVPALAPTNRADAFEANLQALIDDLPTLNVQLKVISLPDGYNHSCDIITAIGHQISDVVSLSVIDDSRILAGIAGSDASVRSKTRYLIDLVNGLAITTVQPRPQVASVTTQLYYDRDAASVATAVGLAFPQLTVTPISTNKSTSYADSLILADPTGGPQSSHSPLIQARRMIAQIDQPRPQVTVNAWSLQAASVDNKKMRALVPESRRFAAGYNDALERSVGAGWTYLNSQVAKNTNNDYLDPLFAAYLCNSAQIDSERPAATSSPFRLHPAGSCPQTDRLAYGLGYTDLFDRESANLVQMMILVLATTHTVDEVENTLNVMEGRGNVCPDVDTTELNDLATKSRKKTTISFPCDKIRIRAESCQMADEDFYNNQQRLLSTAISGLAKDKEKPTQTNSGGVPTGKLTEEEDESTIYRRLRERQPPRYVGFACTRDRLTALLYREPNTLTTTTFLGQFRAAVADFLFQNKMKAEYPDDFLPYLFPASAAKFDSAFTPIIEAFNEDMQALQQHLQTQLTEGIPKDKGLTYTSNGLVSVSVVSGNQASVATQSLNYFPQNPTMKLEDFAKQLVAGASGTSTSSSPSTTTAANPIPALAGSLSGVTAALAAYSAAQPAQVTAKVGSGLSMTVTPYALSSDSGAELAVNVTYQENGAATISSDATKSQASDDLNSRVAQHEVTTLVRMDALKFFEVSTLQSVIARQRAPYKLIDPLVELPLLDGLGVFPNWRRKPQVIYNQSVIFLQAAILPTAADLGNSARMQYDRVFSPSCQVGYGYKEARSADDLNPCPATRQNILARVMDYHLEMVRFFAGQAPSEECKQPEETREKCEPPAWNKIDPVARPENSALRESDPNKKQLDSTCSQETSASGSTGCKVDN
jgi:hypothetical protein